MILQLSLFRNEIIIASNLLVTGNSTITVLPEQVLALNVPSITVEAGSSISANGKGYVTGPGSPDIFYESAASYGGVGGGLNPKPTYGSATAPIDFGSGAEGNRGGGAIRLIVDNLQNDGVISANYPDNGTFRTSGGSIYVTTKNLSGMGSFQAIGGNTSWPYGFVGAGAGGRIAIYYQNSTFTGNTNVLGGVYCFYGRNPAGGAGTVVMQPLAPVCAIDCFSNVLFLPGLMGSRLYEEGLDCGPNIVGPECGDQELWISSSGSRSSQACIR